MSSNKIPATNEAQLHRQEQPPTLTHSNGTDNHITSTHDANHPRRHHQQQQQQPAPSPHLNQPVAPTMRPQIHFRIQGKRAQKPAVAAPSLPISAQSSTNQTIPAARINGPAPQVAITTANEDEDVEMVDMDGVPVEEEEEEDGDVIMIDAP